MFRDHGDRLASVVPSLAAASTVLEPVLAGPPQHAQVVGVSRNAVYVATRNDAVPVIALLSRDAVRVPNGLVVPIDGAADLPGGTATVGDGLLRTAGLVVRVARWWAPRRPVIRDLPGAAGRVDELASPELPPYLHGPVAALGAALRARDGAAASVAALGLLGLGPGLTPSGDDVLAGALVTLRAIRYPGHALAAVTDDLARAVTTHAPRRTHLVSAALLRHATDGLCVPELAAVIDALDRGWPLREPLGALLRIGHRSGGDLAHGVVLALTAAEEPR